MCTVLVSLKASILHSAHFPLKKHSSVALYYSSVALYYRSVALYYSSVALTIVPLHSFIVPRPCVILSHSPLRTYIYTHHTFPSSFAFLPSFLLLRIDIEQCADMSSDLYTACSSNNVEEAMRLLSTATSEDVNYSIDGVLVDMH